RAPGSRACRSRSSERASRRQQSPRAELYQPRCWTASRQLCYYEHMTTTTRTIRCGNCHGAHASPAEVKTCYGLSDKLPGVELPRTSPAEAYSWAYSEDRPRNEQPPTP